MTIAKRVLLKLSGEALVSKHGYGIDPKVVNLLAEDIIDVHHLLEVIEDIDHVHDGIAWAGRR